MSSSNLPPLPRSKLVSLDPLHYDFLAVLHRFRGQVLTTGLCGHLARNFSAALDDVSETNVFQTLLQYVGHELDAYWSSLLARQLVARKEELEYGVLQLFTKPLRNEWVALEVYKATACVWRENAKGVYLHLYCLTGSPAGHVLRKKFPETWLAYLAYQIGYTRRMQYDYEPTSLTGLRLWGYLLAAPGQQGELGFEDWKVDAGMKAYNQSILKLRARFDIDLDRIPESKLEEYSCPIDADHYCVQCHCSVQQCIAAYNRERVYVEPGPSVDRES